MELENQVRLEASGYDWLCPNCTEDNNTPGITEKVTCKACGGIYEVYDEVDHHFA